MWKVKQIKKGSVEKNQLFVLCFPMDLNVDSMAGFTVRSLNSEDADVLNKGFGMENALLEFNPGRCLLPPVHTKFCQQILDASIREDDVWLLSFPRTGSTWCQEMVWLLSNDLNFEAGRQTMQLLRAPVIEMSTILHEYRDKIGSILDNSVEFVTGLPSPRFLRSHLPASLLPKQLNKIKPKIIYTCRNPKDSCVSYYYYTRAFHHFDVQFEQFCDLFLRGLLPIGPFFEHCLPFWHMRHEPNILFLKYEDMKRDIMGTVKKISTFLEKQYTDEQYRGLCDFLSFQNMKTNVTSNAELMIENNTSNKEKESMKGSFIRKGVIGDWKNHMSNEIANKFDAWIEENTKNTGLTFD